MANWLYHRDMSIARVRTVAMAPVGAGLVLGSIFGWWVIGIVFWLSLPFTLALMWFIYRDHRADQRS